MVELVVAEELEKILDYLAKNVKDIGGFNLETKKKVFFDIIYRNDSIFECFKEAIREKWVQFTESNKNTIIKRTYTSFLYREFYDFFSFFLQTFFGLNSRESLDLVIKEKISYTDLLFEFNYYLSEKEKQLFEEFSQSLDNNIKGLFYPTAYIFFIIETLGIIIKGITEQNFKISLEGATYSSENERNCVNFLVIVKDSRKELYEYYYKMVLYYFLKQFGTIPESAYNSVLKGKEKLYEFALESYSPKQNKERLVDLLYYFYRKCELLNNFCPILDFFSFICSRVEDSIFSKKDIIKKDYLSKFNFSVAKKNSLLRIFDYLDRRSTLSSTFLANNLPSIKSQLNLFLLYKKYYFGSGLETLEIGNVLFLPDRFKKNLNQSNKDLQYVINANSILNINSFLDFFALLSNKNNINLIFENILGLNVTEINYEFFKCFFKSLNEKLNLILAEENKSLTNNQKEEPMSFSFIIHHICRMLYVLIDKIFLSDNLEEASKNFIDPRGRYISRNIALRVLELFIFQDYNFSDDLWPDFLLSLNQENISKRIKKYDIELSSKHFYNQTEINRFMITYNFQTFSDEEFLESWLLKTLIIPLNDFIMEITNSVSERKNTDEIYGILSQKLLSSSSKPDNPEDIKDFCRKLARFWETIRL
ncbi:MAG: hypothetical protein BAJALOKI3v1_540007 [Promethearchaeota archaeon]|nr:MAG: hypothetical protein BAJALOKI3v1_540007 [Candidatus Lokiarchaeota archaeon]